MRVRITEELHTERQIVTDPEIIYVFSGRAELTTRNRHWILQKDDFLLTEPGDMLEMALEDRGMAGILALRKEACSSYLEMERFDLRVGSLDATDRSIGRTRQILRDLFALYVSEEDGREAMLCALYYQLLYHLRENCRVPRRNDGGPERTGDDAALQIREYLETHFRENISLSDLARITFFSETYLSRYIREHLGTNFTRLLTQIRLAHALPDVEAGDKNMTRIVMENGFANPVAFARAFRETYGMTPTAYRAHAAARAAEGDAAAAQAAEGAEAVEAAGHEAAGSASGVQAGTTAREHARELFARSGFDAGAGELQTRHIVGRTGETRRIRRTWNRMINAGFAKDLQRADMQSHLLRLREEPGFTLVRFWDLWSPDMMIYDGNPERRYNFSRLDNVLDFLCRSGMHPFIELGFKPMLLAMDRGGFLINEQRQPIFDDDEQMADFLDKFLRHYVGRYGIREVEQWCIELWRDPKDEGYERYVRSFETLYQAVRMRVPNLRIGGPGTNRNDGRDLERVLETWSGSYCHPDFISVYSYPYTGDESYYRSGETFESSRDPRFLRHLVDWAHRLMEEHGFRHQDLFVTEWSFTVSNRNALNDAVFMGAYIARNLIDVLGRCDLIGYWFASDVFSEYYDSAHVINGSGGLITKDGICKPAYYGLAFFNRLRDQVLAVDEHAMITSDLNDEYSIVCHNCVSPNGTYYGEEESVTEIGRLSEYFDGEKLRLHFVIEGVSGGTYRVKKRLLDAEHGSVQDEWTRLGQSDGLSLQDIEYLRRICVPQISIETIEAKDGVIEYETELSVNAIEDIHIFRLL